MNGDSLVRCQHCKELHPRRLGNGIRCHECLYKAVNSMTRKEVEAVKRGLALLAPTLNKVAEGIASGFRQMVEFVKQNKKAHQKVKLQAFCDHQWSLVREGRLVSLEVSPFTWGGLDNAAWVARLYTPFPIRRKGYARQAMQRMCDAAEAANICLVLGINSYGEMSYKDLERFYCSFGFVKDVELSTILIDDGLLVREPKNRAATKGPAT